MSTADSFDHVLLDCIFLDPAERRELQSLIKADKRFTEVKELVDLQESHPPPPSEIIGFLIGLGAGRMVLQTALDIIKAHAIEMLKRRGEENTTEIELPVLYDANNRPTVTIKKKRRNKT